MAKIGNFEKLDDDFQGVIRTLQMQAKVSIVETETKTSENAPDYRVYADNIEVGAAWAGKKSLSVKIDDPSLSAPIYARLVLSTGDLIWSR